MKHYYATGNSGNGTNIYAFNTRKERNDFVAWDTNYDQKSSVTRQEAVRYSKSAIVIKDGHIVPDKHEMQTISLA